MKGNDKILATLNDLLSDELTAINQYMVHAEMADNWQFEELHKYIEERSITEMKHAEKLIARILFLEGIPIVSNLKKITIGAEIEAQFHNDLALEHDAVHKYNDAIRQAYELGDNGTRDLLDSIVKDEEDHVDDLEAKLDQIRMMGIQSFLVEQVD